jgi:glycosyl transferase, family 25
MGAPIHALEESHLVASAEGAAAPVIPVYVINLERSPDRRAFMAEGLARAGVTPEFVAAVDGRACRSTRPPRAALSRGETALILSHRKVWRRFLRSRAEFAVVLEDDAHFGEGLAALIASDWSGFAFDIVKLETTLSRVWLARRGIAMSGRLLRRIGAEHLGSGAYLVSRAGAAKFLKLTRPLDVPVDHSLFGRDVIFERRVSAYQLDPAIALQDVLLPERARTGLVTTLQESDRARLALAAKRAQPRGLARIQRESRRLFEQARRAWRLWPGFRRERVPWR